MIAVPSISRDAVRQKVLDWVTDECSRSGLSRKALAERLGVSPSAITRLFAGERQIAIDELVNLSRASGDTASFARLLLSLSDEAVPQGRLVQASLERVPA